MDVRRQERFEVGSISPQKDAVGRAYLYDAEFYEGGLNNGHLMPFQSEGSNRGGVETDQPDFHGVQDA